jgi:hypothetical protein
VAGAVPDAPADASRPDPDGSAPPDGPVPPDAPTGPDSSTGPDGSAPPDGYPRARPLAASHPPPPGPDASTWTAVSHAGPSEPVGRSEPVDPPEPPSEAAGPDLASRIDAAADAVRRAGFGPTAADAPVELAAALDEARELLRQTGRLPGEPAPGTGDAPAAGPPVPDGPARDSLAFLEEVFRDPEGVWPGSWRARLVALVRQSSVGPEAVPAALESVLARLADHPGSDGGRAGVPHVDAIPGRQVGDAAGDASPASVGAGSHHGTAAAVGDFHGQARIEVPDLTERELEGEILNDLRLVTPDGMRWNPDTRQFVLPDGRVVRVRVAAPEDGTAVADFQARADGSGYDVNVSPRARTEHVSRAVAHELAEIWASTDPRITHDPVSERPTELTDHLIGRFAELKVVVAHLDRAVFDPARAKDVLRLHNDLNNLLDHLGLRDGPAAGVPHHLLASHDPLLAHRLALVGRDAFGERPIFGPDLTEAGFDAAKGAHLDRLEQAMTGDHVQDLLRAESLSLDGRMHEEQARQIFDPIFEDRQVDAARRAAAREWDAQPPPDPRGTKREKFADLFNGELDPVNAAINDPRLDAAGRSRAVLDAINGLEDAAGEATAPVWAKVREVGGFDAMRSAAQDLAAAPDRIAGVLDHATGEVVLRQAGPGFAPGDRMTLRDLFTSVDRANRTAAEHGLNLEYTPVIHLPEGGLSSVELLPRPRPQHRLPATGYDPVMLEPRPPVPAAQAGGHIIDVGVGRSAFGVEMTSRAGQAGEGLVIQTELPGDFAIAGQRRRNLGILDPGPLGGPGSLMVFGDLLGHGQVLGGHNGGVARVYINNVSAGFSNMEPYLAIARQLGDMMIPGGRVEVQWDMKPEKPIEQGGAVGDRGHIQGDLLFNALDALNDPRWTISLEETIFPGDGNMDYRYSIDAGGSNRLDQGKMAKYTNPMPERRAVITFEARV